MQTWVAIVVALIGAVGVAGGPIAVVLIQKARREQADFRLKTISSTVGAWRLFVRSS